MIEAPTAYVTHVYRTSPLWCKHWARGCGGIVVDPKTVDDLLPGPIALFGSLLFRSLIDKVIEEKRDWYYGDHAFFKRGKYYRIMKNDYQFHGPIGEEDSTRFEKFQISIKPWSKGGSFILVTPPGRIFSEFMGMKQGQWLEDTIEILKKNTDREIRVRTKPGQDLDIQKQLRLNRLKGRPKTKEAKDHWRRTIKQARAIRAHARMPSIEKCLNGAHALVTWMSNTAQEAVLNGVPAFCSPNCATSLVGNIDLTKIESPDYPEGRFEWASALANRQWNFDEMRRGDTWRYFQEEAR